MPALPNIVLPATIRAEYLQQQIKDAYFIWRAGWDETHPIEPTRNVEFEHDPNWRSNWMSIQAAHDGVGPVWKATKVIVTFSQVMGVAGPLLWWLL